MIQIVDRRKIWLSFSSLLTVVALVFVAIWGLNFGIDFTGGSLLEINFLNTAPSTDQVRQALSGVGLSSLMVQSTEGNNFILRFQEISEATHQQILIDLTDLAQSLNPEGYVDELRFESVGPSIGQELKTKAVYAVVIALVAIILYIAWAFSKVSKPVASWKYGLTAIIALAHNIIIVLGVFAVLGRFFDVEVNTPFVAAILTILGYSVNDTIVVFDRIRENLPKSDEDFETTVNLSVNQSLSRSINTSVTTLIVLLSVLFFGGSTIQAFMLALSIGVFVGTYSSLFLASPLLVVWEKFKK
jgi:preprotein translocase subunit SecF